MIVIALNLYALIPGSSGKCSVQCFSHGHLFPGCSVPWEPSQLSSNSRLLLERSPKEGTCWQPARTGGGKHHDGDANSSLELNLG